MATAVSPRVSPGTRSHKTHSTPTPISQHILQTPSKRPIFTQSLFYLSRPGRFLFFATGLFLALIFLSLLVNTVTSFTQSKLDDLTYGNPRTFQMNVFVGHHEQEGLPSHFIALNLNRRVVVMELQGGDPKVMHIYQGPYLFGQDEDTTPVRLMFRDLTHSGYPDMILIVKNEQIVFMNDPHNQTFRLMRPEEKKQVEQALGITRAGPK